MRRIKNIVSSLFSANPTFLVALLYGDFWKLRESCIRHQGKGWRRMLYNAYLDHYGSFIGLGANFASIPQFPHGLFGVFISNSAKIGKNVTIFQHVTIGSNTLKDSKNAGAPTIGDNVYIGVGGVIIGKVTVGNNSRIGAGCIVVKDTPENSVTVLRGTESIVKSIPMNNNFVKNSYQ